jgi:hypothetical protein
MSPAEKHRKTTQSNAIMPWTVSVYRWLPGNPTAIGVSVAIVLVSIFLLTRFIANDPETTDGDFRLSLIHILLTAFVPCAYVYLISVTKEVAVAMQPVFGQGADIKKALTDIGKYNWWKLLLAALVGVLVNLYATTLTTVGSDPWVWQEQNFDTKWMRILGPTFCGWMGCIFYVLVIESSRLSSLSNSITSIDLLDLQPYKPLIRQGLTNVLLVVGIASIVSLFLLEPGFDTLLFQLSILFSIFAWIGLMLPLRGIRRKIDKAKKQELAWCTEALQNARNSIKSDAGKSHSITEVVAYKALIESIRNWPFDSTTLARFALYLLIPLCSIFGGAFVERWLDLFLP